MTTMPSSIPVYSSISGNVVNTQTPKQSKPWSKATTKSPKGFTAPTAGPVVYKREKKLKLRATISPAIFEELQNSSHNETGDLTSHKKLDAESTVVSPPPQSSTPLNGHHNASNSSSSKKKIKWHKQRQVNENVSAANTYY